MTLASATRPHGKAVPVLEADPDLGARIPDEERHLAAMRLVAPEYRARPGRWDAPKPMQTDARYGLLVTEGIVAGTTAIHGREHTELLGPGDLLQPWLEGSDGVLVPTLSWRVQSPLVALVLDRRFALAAAPWPEVPAALMNRLVLRSRRLSFQMAASSLPRASDRLLLMLWHFAERWGRVTTDGVVLELPMTHSRFASVVGTRRPSFTTAVTDLRGSGRLLTRGRSTWILRPPAPNSYAELRAQVGLPHPRPTPLP